MRCAAVAIALVLLVAVQLAHGQKELPGAYIEGNDWCPQSGKQQQAPQPTTPQRSNSLTRIFSRQDSQQKQQQPAAAPACKMPFKYCGTIQSLVQRCKTTFGCRAVSYDGKCGLLKTSDGPRKARPGWSTYVVA